MVRAYAMLLRRYKSLAGLYKFALPFLWGNRFTTRPAIYTGSIHSAVPSQHPCCARHVASPPQSRVCPEVPPRCPTEPRLGDDRLLGALDLVEVPRTSLAPGRGRKGGGVAKGGGQKDAQGQVWVPGICCTSAPVQICIYATSRGKYKSARTLARAQEHAPLRFCPSPLTTEHHSSPFATAHSRRSCSTPDSHNKAAGNSGA